MATTIRFANLPEEKRERIERAAIYEFATYGFEQANTNNIAAAANTSVGALFKYFETKQDLFLHVVHQGSDIIESFVHGLLEDQAPVMVKIERILHLIVETSRTQREFVKLYHELTATGNRKLVHAIALELESYTSATYIELIRQGQASAQIRADLDPQAAAFLLDNVFMSLQFATACEYFEDRRELYAPGLTDQALVEQARKFLEGALTINTSNPPDSANLLNRGEE